MKSFKTIFTLIFCVVLPVIEANGAVQIQANWTDAPIRIDGVLNEDIWQKAIPAPTLIQDEPNEGAQPSQPSDNRIVYDANALYVGARLFDSVPDSIMARLERRDSDMNSDCFLLGLDPYNDKRSGYYFGLSAAGAIYDGTFYNDTWQDDSWDGVWESAVKCDKQGWSLEMRIPFSQLRFKKSESYTWGINLYRKIHRKNEEDFIAITPRNESGLVSRFVDLVGIENIDAERKMEILPYVRSKAEYLAVDPDDPFNDGSRFLGGVGADFKVGVGNNLTFDGTINPDFGQVEVDPAVINLSDVETYYDEKRPFFIEGSKTFNFGQGGSTNYWNINFSSPNLLYSRRIGRAPQADLSDYDYADVPEGSRIISAGKLTGKIGGNWNVGLLNATTAREFAKVSLDGENSKVEAQPLTNYSVLRTQKEFKEGQHGLGILTTLTKRFFDDQSLSDNLNEEALVVGLDGWSFLDTGKTWVIAGWGGLSNISGTQTCITNIQTNSRHYFQQPNADHFEVDSSATSLTGYATRINLNKQKGRLICNAALGVISPGFDVNDLGYSSSSDVINYHIGSGYKWTEPTKTYRYFDIEFALARTLDCVGHTLSNSIMNFGYYQFLNYYSINWGNGYFFETYDNRLTRGGPLTISPTGVWGYINFSSDSRKKFIYGLYFETSGSDTGSVDRYLEIPLEWKIADNLSFEIEPELSLNHSYAHWVDDYDDIYATATYGKRYVFAEMDQTTLSASLRLDWTFTPRLSLQLYAQPLMAAGDYYNFKELARPKSYEFSVYGKGGSTITENVSANELTVDPDGNSGSANSYTFDNPDFNVYSFRSSAVLRWEFARGSTVYLVWTHNRFDDDDRPDFNLNRSFSRIGRTKPNNIFMVKATYWFNV
ncbi:MAG: DUF5916 domain-containing protein [Candidatus Marinimicrobia bacterium]|nr:DUF5916 domain-containing protein [Candidatus Neomarinimicrobiota bacterium]